MIITSLADVTFILYVLFFAGLCYTAYSPKMTKLLQEYMIEKEFLEWLNR